MPQQRTELRHIAWLDLCPWLMLFRCPGLALRVETMFLATVGGVLTSLVWWLGELVFLNGSTVNDPVAPVSNVQATPPGKLLWESLIGGFQMPTSLQWSGLPPHWQELLALDATPLQFFYLVTCGLLTLLIWAVIGGAISRSAVVQLAREERISLVQSLTFACSRLASFFFAPLMPLFGAVLFVLGVFLFVGLPMNLDVGLIWAGLVWILVLVFGLLVGVLLLGLIFGWPLMWATISSEGSDAFDALSRSYAYTFQRPLHYFFYALLLIVMGLLMWALVLMFGEAVIQLSWWAADWGVFEFGENQDRMTAIVDAANAPDLPANNESIGPVGMFGIRIIRLVNGFVRAITFSFAFGYFWVSAAAMYLLLRLEVDHTETDEIYLEDDSEDYGLPPLKDDEAGVPELDEGGKSNQAADEGPDEDV